MTTSDTQTAPAMPAVAQKEHQWLQKFVGEWDMEGEMPDMPGETLRGTESVRSLGGLWVIGEGRSGMPDGSDMTMVTTFGYDPRKGKFVGTFLVSVMPELWIYEGTLDEATDTLSLHTEGPDMSSGKTRQFMDTVQFESDDHRLLTSHMMDDAGEWQVVMRGHFRRRR